MSGLSNAQLAQQVSTLVSAWNEREAQFRDWLGGTATGGPNGDGKYPLTDSLGKSSLVDCPARLASTVSGPKADAEAAKLAAQAAQVAASGYAATADQQRALAQAALAAAIAARDLSLQYRDRAANAEANALVYKDAAEAAAAGLSAARDAAVQAKTDAVAAKGAAEAARDLAQGYAAQAATFNPANFAAKVHTHAIADVTGLQAALDAKLAASGFTWASLAGKPTTFAPSAHVHAIADVTSLQAALDGKLTVYPGLTLGYAAWQSNSLGLDSALGDGLLNIVGGANHARMTNATGTGHVYQGTRGASRIGLHDNTINLYVGDKASGAAVAGQAVAWTQVATLATTGFASYVPLTVTGNIVSSGSMFVGASGGLFVNGQAHRIYFDAAGGARASLRTDHATAVGLNLQTSDGSHRGALYYDGALGLLNQVNGWRLRTTSGSVSVYSDAGVEYPLWSTLTLAPMTTNTQQNILSGAWKGFESYSGGDPFATSGGDLNALDIYSDGNRPAVMTFHRHGAFAAYFGMDSDNRFKIGGWSYGAGVKHPLWFNGQIPTSVWQKSDDGKNRFQFTANGGTLFSSADGYIFGTSQNASGFTIDGYGGIHVDGGEVWVGEGHWIRMAKSDGIYWQTWGGGWHMSDASYMRCYGNKHVYTGGLMQADAGMISQGGRVFRHGDGAFGSSSIFMSTAGPSGGASGDIWYQYS